MTRNFTVIDEEFICDNCGKKVPKLGYSCRNHCPYCLCSMHLDDSVPGDRKSSCKSLMMPIAITFKAPKKNKYPTKNSSRYGEMMVVHQCSKCGKISNNRVAADDNPQTILDIFYKTPHSEEEEEEVKRQLYGQTVFDK